jgi:3-isopropylmalate/(R)-2-methylmalate dehydratase small subunit
MEALQHLRAIAMPLLRANVDTDAIIPSREMKTVSKTGLKDGLFAGWRYRTGTTRDPNPEFILNQSVYSAAQIILGGENFGCGSSREHAVWALHEYGFRAVVAPSFAPIFYNNCIRNGVAPISLTSEQIGQLAAHVTADPVRNLLDIDLIHCLLRSADGKEYRFVMEQEAHEMLLEGLDAIDLTMKQGPALTAWLAQDKTLRPWIYLKDANV